MSRLLIILATAVVLSFVAAEDVTNQGVELYIYEQQVNETLKNISAFLAQYDPYLIPKIKLNFEHESGNVAYEVEDILLRGHSQFWATNLRISMVPPSVTFDIRFEEVHILVPQYNIDGLAVFVPFYGSGFTNLKASGINLGGSAKLKIRFGKLKGIKNLKARVNLEKSDLVVSGVLHNEPLSKIISTSTTECFPEFVNTYGDRLGQLAGPYIENLVNRVLDSRSAGYSDIPYTGSFKVGNGTLHYYYEM